MGIEVIKNTSAAYQSDSLSVEMKEESEHRAEIRETVQASTNTAGENPANPQAEESKIKKAIEEINKKANNSEAIFGIHSGTNRVMIKIVDKETKEVIKELPPEKTLDMISKIWEVAGLMVDEKL